LCGFQATSRASLFGGEYRNEYNFTWHMEPDSNRELKIVYFAEFIDSKYTAEMFALIEAHKTATNK
jgi:ketosteroid isomerase-like protein